MKMMIRGQHGARAGRATCGVIGLLDLLAEARIRQLLVGIGLHRTDRTDEFAGIGRGFRQRILRVARQTPHPAPEGYQRDHDQRDRREHEAGELRARNHHHGCRAEKQHKVAQRDGYGRADR
jgi:hypothetical protein